MSDMAMTIGDVAYTIDEASLSVHIQETEDERVLVVDLFADSSDLTRAGFAFNCIALAGLSGVDEMQCKSIELDACRYDGLHELGESVIAEPGGTLELDHMLLQFGSITGGMIPIDAWATCRRLDPATCETVESNIPVEIHCTGTIDSR